MIRILSALLFAFCCQARTIALIGGAVYANPSAPALRGASVVIENGQITALGSAHTIPIPADALRIDCSGLTITAGFWNSDVHFMGPQWDKAGSQPAGRLSGQLERLLTRFGFTTVFDTGSYFPNTDALRKRIQKGEVKGPRIFTAGEPLVAEHGTPYFWKPAELPEMVGRRQSAALAEAKINEGCDGIEMYTGAIVDRATNAHVAIPEELVWAVTSQAHALHKPVFATTQSKEGLRVAVRGNADILTQVTPELGSWPPDLLRLALAQHMALISAVSGPAELAQLRMWSHAGGQILFGADADPDREYALMERAGLNWRQILASLTINPVQRFVPKERSGTIAAGNRADLTIFAGDPAKDIRAFAHVRYTIRGGEIIYQYQASK